MYHCDGLETILSGDVSMFLNLEGWYCRCCAPARWTRSLLADGMLLCPGCLVATFQGGKSLEWIGEGEARS